jgi:hypothetical protein
MLWILANFRANSIELRVLALFQNVKQDSNDGGAGNTFEECLGVRENNLKEPDFEGFEVKTKKDYLKK